MAHSMEIHRGDITAAPVNNCQIATPYTPQLFLKYMQHDGQLQWLVVASSMKIFGALMAGAAGHQCMARVHCYDT